MLAASLLPRLCYGMIGLPLLISLHDGTGSYAVASIATSLFGLAVALLGPARARLIRGRHGVAFMLLATGYVLSLAALAVACATHAPAVVDIVLAVVAGLCPPPVGPRMRAQWSALATDDELRQRALSLDTAAESTAFALGPPIAGTLIAISSAPAVLGGCAVAALAGFGLLAAAMRDGGLGTESEGGTVGKRGGTFGMMGPLVLTWAIAAAMAAAGVVIVVAWGALTAGFLTALLPVGGVVGGLLYGRRRWPGALGRRALILTGCSAVCWALPVLAYAPAAAAAALLLAGACCDILMITTYQLVSIAVAKDSQAEAGAWLNTAYNLGAAMGTAAGGFLADRVGPHASFAAIAGLCAVSSVAVSVLSRRGRSEA
jgi:predicted MFS family arabinose efflux permease